MTKHAPTAYAVTYTYNDPEENGDRNPITVAIVGMDGSVWADWENVTKMANALVTGLNPSDAAGRFFASTLLAARGTFPEVSKERIKEIGRKYGAILTAAAKNSYNTCGQ